MIAVVRPGVGVAQAPDVLVSLAGEPVACRVVRGLLASGVVDRVVVCPASVADAGRIRRAVAACGHGDGEHVVVLDDAVPPWPGAHVGERRGTAGGDASLGDVGVVLVHDLARPLTPPELVASVVAAARAGHAVTVPVLPLTDTVKSVDSRGVVRATPDRAGLCVVQTPQAFRSDLLGDVLAAVLAAPAGRSYAASGLRPHTVPGHPHALALRSAGDLELATALAAAP